MTTDQAPGPDDYNGPDFTMYGLVQPFVVCTSNGGKFSDDAFVAGVRFGELRQVLKALPTRHQTWEMAYMDHQLDLLAMELGYQMTAEPWDMHPDWWTLYTFELL